MEYDQDKVDEMTLALMYLVLHRDKVTHRVWKGFDWEVLDRLHLKGLIGDPKSKAKSVPISEEGVQLCEKLFVKHFGASARTES
jgi:hypothetical protein